jgi:hypothetical protein
MFSRLGKKQLLYGFLIAPVFMVVFVVYSALLGKSDSTYVEELCIEQRCECADWYRGSIGQYQIENNVWNKGDISSYQQCVFISEGNDSVNAGWAWNWPGIRFNVLAYPNIIYGKNPWLPSTSPELPLRIDEIKCLEAKFDVIQEGSGKVNLSIDLWITDNLSSQPSDITDEIMIWLSHEGFWPAGSRVDTLNIEGKEIELWRKENHNPSDDYQWTFLAFVYQSDLLEGSISIHDFLRFLVEKGFISSEGYLAGIQLGNEIVSGYGKSFIRNYEINFCDR